ncbi:MAG: protein-export chaperone SecB [Pseudomonadota bacterium]
MADDNTDGANSGAAATTGAAASDAAQAKPPAVSVTGQYIKDLSFELPGAPQSLLDLKGQMPPMNLQIAVQVKPVSETDYDVELKVEARGGDEAKPVFNLELVYAGLFKIENVSTQQLHPFVHIECPRMLFPFARQIIADTVGSAGLPPIMLQPIDFAGLYRQRMQQMAQQQQAQANA